jgi:cytidylate kinase
MGDKKGAQMSFIVAIDGPAGTGKGTITSLISKEMGLVNIDTGATYRCVALYTIENNIKLEEKDKIIDSLKNIQIDMINENGNQKVFLNGEDVTSKIRNKEVSLIVSQISSIKEVRYKMVDVQRKLAEGKDVIMEGRDITTVVFPNANVKIYMDADEEERAKRRFNELQEKGIEMPYEEVLKNIQIRDKNDKEKEIGALKIAEDAIYLDTTNLSIDEVKNKVINIIKNKI